MRTREEILADGRVVQQLILEVLLDIRDLLGEMAQGKVGGGGDQEGQVPKRKPGRPPKRKEGG